jgi:uncharacterized membrane protein
MDLILLVSILTVVFVLVLLWAKTDEVARRQERADEHAVVLEARLEKLQRTVAKLASAPATAVVQAREAATPVVAPAAAPVMPAAAPARPAAAASGPEVAPRWSAPPPPARREWVTREEILERPAYGPVTWIEPTPGPRGPGLVERILRQLDLTPSTPDGGWSRGTLEAWLEGRMLAVVGGIALLLGAIFFLSLAFSRGWITEPLRVLIGLVAGAGLLVLGELSFTRLRGALGHVLVAVGLAIISLALLAATRLYHVVPVEWGLLGAFVAAAAAAAIAVRHDSQVVAAFGLTAVLASPPILGASPTLVTLLFVASALVGTTGVAIFRTWVWLPPLAFVLAGPQLASYVTGGPPAAEGLVAVAGFWLVNVVAAGGEEVRHSTDRLRTTTVTLLLADAAFTLWAGFAILSGPQEAWRGTFLAVMAVAHLALGLAFLLRNGDRHAFGLVVAATGVAALTMAFPIQFGGPPVPIAWTAEAVALAWVAVIRRHPYSAAVSVLLAVLAVEHLVSIEYGPAELVAGFSRSIPFVGPEGMTFGFMLAALAVTGLIVRIAWVRAGLVAVGGMVAIYVFPFELSGPALVAGWATLAVAGLVAYARVVMPRSDADFRDDRVLALGLPGWMVAPIAGAVSALSRVVRPSFVTAAVMAGVGAIAHLVVFDYPALSIYAGTPEDIPFVGLPGLAFGTVLGAIAATGLCVSISWVRIGLAALGGLVALYVFPFELSGPALVAGWAVLATVAFGVEAHVIERRIGPTLGGGGLVRGMRPAVRVVGGLAGIAALTHLVVLDFPIDQLGRRILSSTPYAGPEGLSLAVALAALAAVGWVMGARWVRLGVGGIGLALLVFTVTYEVGLPNVAVAWSLLALASVAVVRRVAPVRPLPGLRDPLVEATAERLPFVAAGLALLFLGVQSLWLADPLSFGRFVTGALQLDRTPFADQRTYVLAILAATIALSGWAWRGIMPGLRGGVTALVVVAWLLPFEIRPGYAVAGWSALALAGFWALRIFPGERLLLGATSCALAGFGAVVALAVVAPPDRLVVDSATTVLGWPLLTDATVALAALAVAAGAGAFLHRDERLSLPALAGAGVALVYLLSVAVVDQFQLQVASRPLEELQKEAQVGLSALWSIVGAAAFATGLVARRPPIRLFGLALLGLATAKVFLVDLAALDVAYRVLSLVALGVLLLVSAAVYARMQRPRGPVVPRHI